MTHRIFINYTQKREQDLRFAIRLEEALVRVGFQTFRDQTAIPLSQNWSRRLEQEIRACSAMVCLVSNKSLLSNWCLNEIDLAISLNKKTFPIVLQKLDTSLEFRAFTPRFMDIQWYRATGRIDVDVQKIAAELCELLMTSV